MDAYFIVGEPNARKSSILRSLTGCANRSIRDIRLANGRNIRVYARVSSLQESETTPQQFIAEAGSKGVDAVVFCLWPYANSKKPAAYPDAASYVAAFQQASWNFIACAVLGGTRFRPNTPRVHTFPGAVVDPINVTAAAVRQHYRWS